MESDSRYACKRCFGFGEEVILNRDDKSFRKLVEL